MTTIMPFTEMMIEKLGCPCCGAEIESTPHALWFCSDLYEVRVQCNFIRICSAMGSSASSFLDFFVWCCSNLMMDDIRLLVTVLWRVWFRRNKMVHENLKMEVKDIVSWAICYLNDFDDANNKPPFCQSNQHSVKWKRPPEDW
ncbi:hypothetical protein ACOSQ4_017732 [Xanthoceras sorbifolium]